MKKEVIKTKMVAKSPGLGGSCGLCSSAGGSLSADWREGKREGGGEGRGGRKWMRGRQEGEVIMRAVSGLTL